MFKKHSIAIVIGAMFIVPIAFADDTSTEGVIYQADQVGSIATINQVVNEGLPQAAAILQLDGLELLGGAAGSNNAAVIQGITTGNAGIVVDENGNNPTNIAIDDFSDYVIAPTYGVAEDYTNQFTGEVPYLYSLKGAGAEDNYGVVVQSSQVLSRALVIQADDVTVETVSPLQYSLFDGGSLYATAADNDVGLVDGSLNASLFDTNADAEVLITYTGGEIGIDDGVNTIVVGDTFYLPVAEAEGNIAVVTQGANLSFTQLNNDGLSVDDQTDDLADGSDSLNNALVIQGGINSYARIGQQGINNNSAVLQLDDQAAGENVAESFQYYDPNGLVDGGPDGNFSLIAQAGNFNLAQTYQTGLTNSSYVYQYGDGNISTVDQNAVMAVAFVYQSSIDGLGAGEGNVASIYQYAAQ